MAWTELAIDKVVAKQPLAKRTVILTATVKKGQFVDFSGAPSGANSKMVCGIALSDGVAGETILVGYKGKFRTRTSSTSASAGDFIRTGANGEAVKFTRTSHATTYSSSDANARELESDEIVGRFDKAITSAGECNVWVDL